MKETTFELRELKSSDIFPMFKIMGKIGFKDFKDKLTPESTKKIMSAFNQNKEQGEGTKQTQNDVIAFVGINLVADILEVIITNLPSCEQDIYNLLGGISDMKPKQVADLPMITFTEMIVAVIQKEEFKDFFKVVSKLFK